MNQSVVEVGTRRLKRRSNYGYMSSGVATGNDRKRGLIGVAQACRGWTGFGAAIGSTGFGKANGSTGPGSTERLSSGSADGETTLNQGRMEPGTSTIQGSTDEGAETTHGSTEPGTALNQGFT